MVHHGDDRPNCFFANFSQCCLSSSFCRHQHPERVVEQIHANYRVVRRHEHLATTRPNRFSYQQTANLNE